MSFGKGYDFNDDLEDLMYPQSKGSALINLALLPVRLILVYFVIFMSYLFAVVIGFFSDGKHKCDRCNEKYIEEYSSLISPDLCQSCRDKYLKLKQNFLEKLK